MEYELTHKRKSCSNSRWNKHIEERKRISC